MQQYAGAEASGSPALDLRGVTERGPLPKAGGKDSLILFQLND